MLGRLKVFFSYDGDQKNFSDVLQYYACLLLAFALPFNNLLINASIGGLILSWIVRGNYLSGLRELIRSPYLIALVLFFFLHVLGLLRSDNIPEGSFEIEKKLSFALFPLLFANLSNTPFSATHLKRIFLCFTAGCFIVALLSFLRGVQWWIFNHSTERLLYHELVKVFDLHALYFSIYLIFCIFFLFSLCLENTPSWTSFQKFIFLFIVIFFSGMIILLSARSAIGIYVFLAASFIFYTFLKRRRLKAAIIAAALFLSLTTASIFTVPFIRERFSEILHTKFYFSPAENNANGFTLRLVKWSCSFQGLKENPWLGVGTGDSQDYLQLCYKSRNFWGNVFHYNSHNQFLQTGLTLGITGLFVLSYFLFLPLIFFVVKRKLLFFIFFITIVFSSLTESIFERQQGIIFFCFFYCLMSKENMSSAPNRD